MGAHLAQISQLLGGSMPGLADVLKPSASQPAVAPPATRAVTSGRPNEPTQYQPAAAAPSARHSASAPADGSAKAAANGKQAEGEDEWWTE